MEDQHLKLTAILLYFVILFLISYLANKKNKSSRLFASGTNSLSGLAGGLSAGAADMSNWLMMSLPAIVMLRGPSVTFLALALAVGSFLNWTLVSRPLLRYALDSKDAPTLARFFREKIGADVLFQRTLSALSIIFFTIYLAASLVGGAILGKTVFSLDYNIALILTFFCITAFTTLGGFMGMSRSDFFQGLLMFFGIIAVPLVTYQNLSMDRPIVVTGAMMPAIADFGSYIAWGLGYFGQFHIMTRFMAMRGESDLKTGRLVCTLWMLIALVGAIATGVLGRLYYPNFPVGEEESLYFHLAQDLFSPFMTGIMIAAVLAAVIASSAAHLHASSTYLMEDILGSQSIGLARFCVVIIGVVALVIAYLSATNIFSLVGFSWAGLGAAFGPLLLFSIYWSRMNSKAAFWGMLSGACSVVLLEFMGHIGAISGFTSGFSLVPGFLISSVVIIVNGQLPEQHLQRTPSSSKLKLG